MVPESLKLEINVIVKVEPKFKISQPVNFPPENLPPMICTENWNQSDVTSVFETTGWQLLCTYSTEGWSSLTGLNTHLYKLMMCSTARNHRQQRTNHTYQITKPFNLQDDIYAYLSFMKTPKYIILLNQELYFDPNFASTPPTCNIQK